MTTFSQRYLIILSRVRMLKPEQKLKNVYFFYCFRLGYSIDLLLGLLEGNEITTLAEEMNWEQKG